MKTISRAAAINAIDVEDPTNQIAEVERVTAGSINKSITVNGQTVGEA